SMVTGTMLLRRRHRFAEATLGIVLVSASGCRGETRNLSGPVAGASVAQRTEPDSESDPPAALPSAAAPDHTPDQHNRTEPLLVSADVTERASHLFDAIVRGEPSLGDDFFFPKEPFIPLKDVADPAKYFDQLIATYHRDILELHRRNSHLDGAKFVS